MERNLPRGRKKHGYHRKLKLISGICGFLLVICIIGLRIERSDSINSVVAYTDANRFTDVIHKVEDGVSKKYVNGLVVTKLNKFLKRYEYRELKHQSYKHISCDVLRNSPQYSEECNNTGTDNLNLLITGTGRSGTEYLQILLNELGLKLAHDTIGPDRDGAVSWPQAFNENKCGKIRWNWERDVDGRSNTGKVFRFNNTIQVIRDPLKQILSRANKDGFAKSGNKKYTACLTGLYEKIGSQKPVNMSIIDYSLLLALRHWVLFNSFIEKYVDYAFRVEDLRLGKEEEVKLIQKIFSVGGFEDIIPSAARIEESVKILSKNTHHSHTKKPKGLELSWKYLENLDKEFAMMAQIMSIKYGYVVPSDTLLPDVVYECENGYQLRRMGCFFGMKEKWRCSLEEVSCS